MPRKKSQNKNSGYKDKLFRIDAELAADLESIAEEQGTSQTTIVHEALKLYRDKRYMSEKASALPSELTETLLAANALLEKKLNAKSNQLLSSMGIELFVIQCILAHNLEIAPDEVERYRREAADFLRTNNRTLRMEEIYKCQRLFGRRVPEKSDPRTEQSRIYGSPEFLV